jgi:UDP-N-acetylglucosamine 2-epimerase
MTKPQIYSEFISLLYDSKAFITDSGGAQAEASILGIPTFTLLNQAPWPETVKNGSNTLLNPQDPKFPGDLTKKNKKFFFVRNASSQIVNKIISVLGG